MKNTRSDGKESELLKAKMHRAAEPIPAGIYIYKEVVIVQFLGVQLPPSLSRDHI